MGFWLIFLDFTKENLEFQKLPKMPANHFVIVIKHLQDVLKRFWASGVRLRAVYQLRQLL